jgi:ATP-binding cassette, subfamily F, member 3
VQEETVLQHVIRSDRVRERYLKEANGKLPLNTDNVKGHIILTLLIVLSTALDGATDPTKPVKALRTVKHERLLRKLDETRQIALRRSGARGWDARKVLIATEEEVKASEEKLNEDLSDIEATVLSRETKEAAEMLADIQTALELVSVISVNGWLYTTY